MMFAQLATGSKSHIRGGLNEALGEMLSSNTVENPAPLPLSILNPSSNLARLTTASVFAC